MKTKKESIAFLLLIIALVIAIGFIIVSILGNKSKEVKVAKEFVTKLQKMDIIDTEININEVEFKSVGRVSNKNSIVQYTVVAENIGIDLDSEYVVTGFSQKLKESRISNSNMDKNKAKVIAEEYLDKITDENFNFKEIRESKEDEKNSNTYTIAFYKYFKDYPYYDNEIVVNINKNTGKLESYMNQSISEAKHNINKNKNIKVDEVKSIALDHFNKLNIESEIIDEPLLAFILSSNGEFELSYVVDMNIINANKKEEKYKLFINAESGEVINRTKEQIEVSSSK